MTKKSKHNCVRCKKGTSFYCPHCVNVMNDNIKKEILKDLTNIVKKWDCRLNFGSIKEDTDARER
jgi:hypothetical protein